MSDYAPEEMSILGRMKRVLMEDHGWERDDFEDMTFLDIEYAFLEVEEDFR